jgi:hypothetical protein
MNTCVFSPCRTYRYSLVHEWNPEALRVAFVMLNPSTADEGNLDPTLRRCKAFAQAWGYGSFVIGNLFAFRATDPRAMKAADDPIGPENDAHLLAIVKSSHMTIAAWGQHGKHRERAASFLWNMRNVRSLHALEYAKDGTPKHPLYLRGDLVPRLYKSMRAA